MEKIFCQKCAESPVKLRKTEDLQDYDKNTIHLPAGQRNALARAKSYLDLMAFSKQGLKDQLVFDGFSDSDAQFAVDHCGANWYEQAARSAREYAKYGDSRNDLIEQLVYIKFTNDQAVYGVNRL